MVIKNGKAVGGGGREIRQIRPIGLIGDRRDRIPGDRTPKGIQDAGVQDAGLEEQKLCADAHRTQQIK